jgi:C4-dicarboxylate-binding protein DctP
MRRAIAAALLALALAAPAVARGAGEAAGAGPAAAAVVMRIGHAQPVGHPRHESLLRFKALVEQRSGGAVRVDVFPAGQLGDEGAMLDAVKRGDLQGTRSGLFERVSPRLLVYTMPFLFDSLDGIEQVTMGPIGEAIAADAEANGLIVLTTGDAGGFRQITNDVRPVLAPADLRGLRIRAPGVLTGVLALRAFGAEVVTIPYGETYQALKSGAADGQENPFINIAAMKFFEVQRYLTVIDYQFHPDPFVVNPAWFRSLPPDKQKLLRDCAVESMRYNNRLVRLAAVRARDLVGKAMEVVVLTPAQRQAFIDAARPVYDDLIAEGITTQAELDAIRSAAR